jgi:hypothetical protein
MVAKKVTPVRKANATYNTAVAGYRTRLASPSEAQAHALAGYGQLEAQAFARNKQALGTQQRGYQQLIGGYDRLQEQALAGLEGAGGARRQEIADQYAMSSGQATQNMISRGLGNSTVTTAVQRGVDADRSKSLNSLEESLRQQKADVMGRYGMARLGLAQQGLQANTAQSNYGNQMLTSLGQGRYSMLGQFAGQNMGYAQQNRALAQQERMQQAGYANQLRLQEGQYANQSRLQQAQLSNQRRLQGGQDGGIRTMWMTNSNAGHSIGGSAPGSGQFVSIPSASQSQAANNAVGGYGAGGGGGLIHNTAGGSRPYDYTDDELAEFTAGAESGLHDVAYGPGPGAAFYQ